MTIRILIRFTILLMLAMPLAGCPQPSSTTPPTALAPGYIDLPDQKMGEIISGARTFYSTIQCETKGLNWSQAGSMCVPDPNITTPLVLSAAEKTAFNDFGASINIAEVAHLAYHNGTGTLTAAQTAVTATQQKQSSLPALAVTK